MALFFVLIFFLLCHVELFIIHLGIFRNPKYFYNIIFNRVNNLLISSIFVPNRESILISSNWNDNSGDFICIRELFTNHSQNEVFPQLIRNLLLKLIISDLPSSTLRVLRILPSRLDTFHEQINHRSCFKLTWSFEVLIHTPKLLNCIEISYLFWLPVICSSITRFNVYPKSKFSL